MINNAIVFLVFLVTTIGCATTNRSGATDTGKPKQLLYMSMTRTLDNSKLRYFGGVPTTNRVALTAACEKTVAQVEAAPWPAFFLGRIIDFVFGAISSSLEKKLKEYTAQLDITHSPQTFFRVSNPNTADIKIEQEVLCIQVTRASCPVDWDKNVCKGSKQTVLFDLILKVDVDDVNGSYFQLEPLQLYYRETKALSKGKTIVEVRASADSVWRDGNESFRREIFDERLLKEQLMVSGGRTVDQIGKISAAVKAYDALGDKSKARSTRLPVFPWSEPAKEHISVGELKIVIKEVGDAPTLLKFAHRFFSDNQKSLVELVQGSISD